MTRGRCLQSGREVALKRLSLEPPKGWLGRSEGSNAVRQLLREEVSILRELREASPHATPNPNPNPNTNPNPNPNLNPNPNQGEPARRAAARLCRGRAARF